MSATKKERTLLQVTGSTSVSVAAYVAMCDALDKETAAVDTWTARYEDEHRRWKSMVHENMALRDDIDALRAARDELADVATTLITQCTEMVRNLGLNPTYRQHESWKPMLAASIDASERITNLIAACRAVGKEAK